MSTPTPAETIKERTRRPRAQHPSIILAQMDERLLIAATSKPEDMPIHLTRFCELVGELKRRLNKDESE